MLYGARYGVSPALGFLAVGAMAGRTHPLAI
nr:MAG TPA: hypothetical protein [Caudoviricetes sp.]